MTLYRPLQCPICKQLYNAKGLCINPKCWVDSNPKVFPHPRSHVSSVAHQHRPQLDP